MKKRHAHHIKHATYNPKLRYSVKNGITLCADCHSLLHNKFAGGYRYKCDQKQLNALIYARDYFLVTFPTREVGQITGTVNVGKEVFEFMLVK